jgi:hypothetical protein
MMHLIRYLRQSDRVFETWLHGVEAMDNCYRLLDLTVWAAGEVGGLAGGLAAMVGRQGPHAHEWTAHLSVAATSPRLLRRSGREQALNLDATVKRKKRDVQG